MSGTFTVGITYAHTVTHVATKMLLTLKEIIREIGLDPGKFVADWRSNELALTTWLTSRHLRQVTLEVYDPRTDALVKRWDMDVIYSSIGSGSLWVDTAAVRYAIAKAGLAPSSCKYDLKLTNSSGRPDVAGWSACEFRSTEKLRRYAIGATIGGNGLSAEAAYWST